MRRFRLLPLPDTDAPVRLPEDATHHLVRVLRCRDGEAVQAFDGEGQRQDGLLRHLDEAWWFEATGPRFQHTTRAPLHLVLGLPKGPALDLALRMATEIGVSEIHPVFAQHSVKQRPKPERWQKILVSAAQQCRRDDVPLLHTTAPLPEVLQRLAGVTLFLAHPDGQGPTPVTGATAALIGPEAGWSAQEVEAFEAAGARRIALGPTILRTPTATAVTLGWLNLHR